MFRYYLWLATRSIKSSPWLSSLMILAIALGIGAFMTTYTLFYAMSSNPIPHKSDKLFAVQLDSWSAEDPWGEPNEPPPQLTYQDAKYLAEAGQAKYQTAMFRSSLTIQPENKDIKPFQVVSRMTYSDFFPMFEPPFLYGGSWSREDDEARNSVVVLSKETNDKVFGGENSVGRQMIMNDKAYTVIGVLGDFNPKPYYYDLVNGGDFAEPEDIYLPFRLNDFLKLTTRGSTSCWKSPDEPTYEGKLRSECIWVGLWVQLDTDKEVTAYHDFLNNYVNEQKKLGRFERPLNNRLNDVMSWLDIQGVIDDDIYIAVGLSFSFLLVCLINTVGLMLAKFLRKSGEVGVRRALGASRLQIFIQYLTEAGLLGVAGALLGLVLAWVGLLAMRQITFEEVSKLMHLNVELIFFALIISILSSLLAGLYPTWRACQITPAIQLKSQ